MRETEYRAFEYLPADVHGRHTLSEPQVGESFQIPLTEEEEHRYERAMERNHVISLHDHPIAITEEVGRPYERYTDNGWQHIPYHVIAKSPLDSIIAHPVAVRTWDEAIETLGKLMADTDKAPSVQQCRSVTDLVNAHNAGDLGLVFGLETTTMIEDKLDRLDVLYGFGVRVMNIVYSRSNMAATGYRERNDGGLTGFGYDVVERMNRLGIALDVSHGSKQTILDVCQVSDDPVLLTHNGAQELINVSRINCDETLQAVAETDGLIGIQAGPYNTVTPEHPSHSIESVMEHFEYVRDLVGIDHVTFGPDTLYGDHVALQEYFGHDLNDFPDFVEEIEAVRGMDNPTESWHNIIRWLVREGYSDSEIEKVLGVNTLRVLQEIW